MFYIEFCSSQYLILSNAEQGGLKTWNVTAVCGQVSWSVKSVCGKRCHQQLNTCERRAQETQTQSPVILKKAFLCSLSLP